MASDSTGEAPIHPGPSKGLLFLVKAMGIVLVLLFLALIGGIIWKATHKSVSTPAADVITEFGIDPAGIRHLELDGNHLAISTDQEVLVLDVKQRSIIMRGKKP